MEELTSYEQPTLRDLMAMSVLNEVIRSSGQINYRYGGCYNILIDDCHFAYKIADAMIKVREKPPHQPPSTEYNYT